MYMIPELSTEAFVIHNPTLDVHQFLPFHFMLNEVILLSSLKIYMKKITN